MSGQLQLSPRDLENMDSFVPFGQSPGAFQGEKYRLSLSFKEFCLAYILRYTTSCFGI